MTLRHQQPVQAGVARRTIAVLIVVRLALNLHSRIVYPFLPALSRGLGVPLETASLLLTVRALLGATSPIYGFLSDRYGRIGLMLVGLAAMVAGCLLVALSPTFAVALVAFALLGLSKSSFDPAMQAYIGDTIPYERRGRVMALLELVWAGSWLIGVPAAGFLITRYGWRSPFLALALLGMASTGALWWISKRSGAGHLSRKSTHANLNQAGDSVVYHRRWQPAWVTRSALLALVVSALLVTANENVFIVYGAWMESQFGLTLLALGLASTVISLAELVGEGASATLVDRIGKRQAVMGGIILNLVAMLLLPRLAGVLAGGLAGVVLIFLTFEFTIVSMLPLVSELAPEARGTVMAFNVAAMSAGRMAGSLTGPRLWEAGQLPLNALVSAVIVLLAALVLWLGVKEASVAAAEPPAGVVEGPYDPF